MLSGAQVTKSIRVYKGDSEGPLSPLLKPCHSKRFEHLRDGGGAIRQLLFKTPTLQELLCLIMMSSPWSLITRPEIYLSLDPMRPSLRSWILSGLLVFPGVLISLVVTARPVQAQCMLTGWMGGGYCYDWVNMYSGSTVRIFPSGGSDVQAQTPFGVMNGVWVAPGDAVLDAGDQLICCYGQRSTGLQYGICRLCR